jgi:hypothetical protein
MEIKANKSQRASCGKHALSYAGVLNSFTGV